MLSCYGNRLQLVMFGMKSEWNACYSGRCKVYDDWLSDTELMEEIYFKGFSLAFKTVFMRWMGGGEGFERPGWCSWIIVG